MVGLAVILILIVVVAPIVSLIWIWRLSGQVAFLQRKLMDIERAGLPPLEASRPETPMPEASFQTEAAASEREDMPSISLKTDEINPDEILQEAPAVLPKRAWEETLASNWMVWVGGFTVALAAVFLFRFAIDQGYLTPLTRVVLGITGGGFLLAAGEWALKRPALSLENGKSDFVPPALSAAGIFAIFVSLYAAHALYGLIGPASAFIAMGLTAYSAMGLALRQGWFVALLGIAAGYIVPLLVDTPESNAIALFTYLFFVTLAALAVMVWRHWRWFSVLTVAGAFFWPGLWLLRADAQADESVLGIYLVAVSVVFAALSPQDSMSLHGLAAWRRFVGRIPNIGYSVAGALLVLLSLRNDYSPSSFAFLTAFAAISFALGAWRPRLESLPAVAATVTLIALLLWPVPEAVSLPERAQELGRHPIADPFGTFIMPPEFKAFSRGLAAFVAVFGFGGFLALGRVSSRALYSGLSAFMPIALFSIGYWRIAGFAIEISWALWAAGLAAAMLGAATWCARSDTDRGADVSVAFYAAGVTAALALMFACVMREAWLTVALSAEVAALAWIWQRLRIDLLKAVAVAVVGVVTLRLVANPNVLDYDGSALQIFGWVVYGYGLPAAFIAWAAHVFARNGRDLTVVVCEIAAVGFGALMVAAQLKLWTAGSLEPRNWDFLDLAVQANWWMVAGGLLLYRRFAIGRNWAQAGGLIVLSIGALILISGPLLSANPLLSLETVGAWPIMNLLTVAFLIPAGLLLALGTSKAFCVPGHLRQITVLGAGVLLFIDLTLEVRRAFWGNEMILKANSIPSNAEVYAYSAAWTVFALMLLGLGIAWNYKGLRYASLGVLLITVAKLFLYDMSDLTGLYRVASFLGLGLTLIGIGRIYQKFVVSTEPVGGGGPSPV